MQFYIHYNGWSIYTWTYKQCLKHKRRCFESKLFKQKEVNTWEVLPMNIKEWENLFSNHIGMQKPKKSEKQLMRELLEEHRGLTEVQINYLKQRLWPTPADTKNSD